MIDVDARGWHEAALLREEAARIASGYAGYSSEVISRITRPPVRRWKSRTRAWVASAVRLPTTRLTTSRMPVVSSMRKSSCVALPTLDGSDGIEGV